MSKIDNVLSYVIYAVITTISFAGMYGLYGYDLVTNAERLTYCGLVVGLVTMPIFGLLLLRVAQIENKIDELNETNVGN